MNFLDNRELLRNLLKQGDQFNIINGGVVSPQVNIENFDDRVEIVVYAAGVSPENFQINLKLDQLIVMATISSLDEESVRIPLFVRLFHVPSIVDIDQIDAVDEDGRLKIIMPFKGDLKDVNRSIKIRQL